MTGQSPVEFRRSVFHKEDTVTKEAKMQDNFGRRLKTQLIMVFVSIITVMMVLVSWFTYKKVEAVVEKQSADITQQYFQKKRRANY